jgi:hypothetical protein
MYFVHWHWGNGATGKNRLLTQVNYQASRSLYLQRYLQDSEITLPSFKANNTLNLFFCEDLDT